MEKTKESYNFLLYGDSISKGVVYDDQCGRYVVLDDSYASILQNRLKGVVNNAARFGNTVKKGFTKLQNDIVKHNPDIVLIEFGGNDCDYNWEEIAENPLGEHSPKTDFNMYEKLLRLMVENLQKVNIIPVLMTLPPIDADKYFSWVSKNSSLIGDKILTWLGSVNKIYWWQERYNSAIISIAQETKARWIDVRSAFLRQPDYTKFICADGIHPNIQGHQIIAEKVIDYLKADYQFLLKEST